MKSIIKLFLVLISFSIFPLKSYSQELVCATDTPMISIDWYYINKTGTFSDEIWYFTSNRSIADVEIDDCSIISATWWYFDDSASTVSKWVWVTQSPSIADRIIYISDDKLKRKLLGE